MTPDQDDHDILKDRLIREQFRNASAAAKNVNDVVERSIAANYGDIESVERGVRMPWDEMKVVVWFLGIVFLIPIGVAGGSLAVGATALVMLASIAGFSELAMRDNDPWVQLKAASRKLTSAIKQIPDIGIKQSLDDFQKRAKRNFVLGYLSKLQKQILSTGKNVETLGSLQKEGRNLIEKNGAIFHWTDTESLLAAFQRGQLPDAGEFATDTRKYLQNVQNELEQEIQKKNRDDNVPKYPVLGHGKALPFHL